MLLLLGCIFLANSASTVHKYALNTKNHFTHRILIDFPQRNIDTFSDMTAYTDMVVMGVQKIAGITEIQLQKISSPFTDNYVYQMVMDAVVGGDSPQIKADLENFCRYHNLTLNDFGECPAFANKVNFFMAGVGLAIILGVLYFFATLLKLALMHERHKINTLQLMGAPRSMISMLFQKEIKRLITKVMGAGIAVVMIFYAIRYYQASTKAAFFMEASLYINTLLIPACVAIVTILLARLVLLTQIPGEKSH